MRKEVRPEKQLSGKRVLHDTGCGKDAPSCGYRQRRGELVPGGRGHRKHHHREDLSA
jgi:hypothetical protein